MFPPHWSKDIIIEVIKIPPFLANTLLFEMYQNDTEDEINREMISLLSLCVHNNMTESRGDPTNEEYQNILSYASMQHGTAYIIHLKYPFHS